MAFKYKLKEAPSPNLAAQVGAKIGDVSYSKDGDTKFVVNSIDKETGQIGWKVIELPAFDKLNDDVDELVSTAKGVYTKTKSDEEFRKIYEEARLLRNKIRKHLRNEYPDEYKRMTMEGEIEEATGVDGDVMDLNPNNKTKASNYVKLPHHLAAVILDLADELMADEADTIKNQPQIKQALALLKKAAEKAMTGEKEVEEVSTSGAAGAYNTPYAFVRKKLQPGKKKKKKKSKYKMKMPSGMVSSLGYTMGEGKLGDGADLGPGPKAGPDGVTDSAYTKQFKYKLVPKNKDGTYVQKGSGMIVKKLF
jgi:hypothetical protein